LEPKSPASDVWREALNVLDEILGRLEAEGELARATSEWRLREILKRHLRAFSEEPGTIPRHGDIGIFDPEARGGCVRVLLVPCSSRTFYERAFDVMDIAQICQPRLQGVMFLPVSWKQLCEHRLATYVSSILRKYGVAQTCVKFPLLTSLRCY